MKKPTPGELRDVDVRQVSLVDRGANGRQFRIFKAADTPETRGILTQVIQALSKLLKGAGDEDVEDIDPTEPAHEIGVGMVDNVEKANPAQKATTFSGAMAGQDLEEGLWRGWDACRKVMRNILEDDDYKEKAAGIEKALNDFVAWVMKRVNAIGVTKAAEFIDTEEVEKAGRKISANRLKSLKDAVTLLSQVIAEAEADAAGTEDTEVTKAEFDAALAQATEDLNTRIATLETTVKTLGELEATVKAAPDQAQAMATQLEAAIKQAVEPLAERVAAVEKARAVSQGAEATEKAEKTKSVFGNLFTK